MSDSTKQFLIVLTAVVVSALVVGASVLFASSLWRGTASIPEHYQLQLWGAIVTVIVAISTGFQSYVNVRNSTINRENSNSNASITQNQVAEVLHEVKNGIPAKTAAIVRENAEQTAEALKEVAVTAEMQHAMAQVATNSEIIKSLGERLDTLLRNGLPVPLSESPATLERIEGHTAQIAANTESETKP